MGGLGEKYTERADVRCTNYTNNECRTKAERANLLANIWSFP